MYLKKHNLQNTQFQSPFKKSNVCYLIHNSINVFSSKLQNYFHTYLSVQTSTQHSHIAYIFYYLHSTIFIAAVSLVKMVLVVCLNLFKCLELIKLFVMFIYVDIFIITICGFRGRIVLETWNQNYLKYLLVYNSFKNRFIKSY